MFYHIVSNEDTKLLKINNIGFSADSKNNRFGPGQRDLYLIHYVISGEGFFNKNPVHTGQGFLIKPNTYECYFPSSENPWQFLWVTSQDSAMEEIFKTYNADKNTGIFNYNYINAVTELTKTLKQNHNKSYPASEILEIFLNLFNKHKKVHNGYQNTCNIYYDSAINYIHANILSPLKVVDITEILGITQPYLYRIFKQKCDMSPKQYINNRKLQKAKKLLRETSMTIGEVAYSTGFNDPFVFSNFFKSKSVLSPLNFRNNLSIQN